MKILRFITLFVIAGTAFADDQAVMVLGQRYTTAFYDGDMGPIWASMTQPMQDALGNEDGLHRFRRQVDNQVGSEASVLSESVEEVLGQRTYRRVAQFDGIARPITVSWTFDNEDRVAGFYIRPQQEPAPSPYLDYDTQARLYLPFRGEWFVYWGGRTVDQNYHAAARDQRFAYDLLVVRNGSSHWGDGSRLEQFYCWGEAILAPADGTVTSVVSGLPDNAPGVMDSRNPAGNHIIIDFDNEEYALFAHLQNGSIGIAEGEDVEAGQPIGRCGNSGNTSEPHLHFHLQDSDTFGDGDGKPAFFYNYRSNGTRVARGEPVRGETISP